MIPACGCTQRTAMCAYLVIVGDTIPVVLRTVLVATTASSTDPRWWHFLISRRVIIFLSTVLVSLPLSLHREISKLAGASAFALLSLLFIVFAVVVEGPLERSSSMPTPTPVALTFVEPRILQVGFIDRVSLYLTLPTIFEPPPLTHRRLAS